MTACIHWNPRRQGIGQILLPEICSNACFGGPKRNRLFMTASQSLYAVYVEIQRPCLLRWPAPPVNRPNIRRVLKGRQNSPKPRAMPAKPTV